MVTVHLWITGKVQGVFYRATALKEAQRLQLNGWIKNTENGAVEATVSGSDSAVEQFIDWCWKGPENAHVENVTITPSSGNGLVPFQVMR